MIGRLVTSVGVFIGATILVAGAGTGFSTASGGIPGGIGSAGAVLGIILGLIAAVLAWRRYPDDAARAEEREMLGGIDTGAIDQGRAKERSTGFTLFVFVGALLVTMAALSSWTDPGSGALDPFLSSDLLMPALIVAVLAASLAHRGLPAKKRRTDPAARSNPQPAVDSLRAGFAESTSKGADALGRGLAAPAKLTKSVQRGFGGYRAGGPVAGGSPDWALLAALFVGGCGFFAIAIARDAGPAFLIAALLFGATAAIGYDRHIARVLRFAISPGFRDILLLLICTVTMLVMVANVGIAAAPFQAYNPPPAALPLNLIGRILSVMAALLVTIPLLGAVVRPAPPAGEARPLWPLFAALIGGGVCWLIGGLMWSIITAPLLQANLDWTAAALSAVSFPAFAMMIGAAGSVWYQGLTSHNRAGFDWQRLFPIAIRVTMLMTMVSMSLCLWVALGQAAQWDQATAEGSIIGCLVWLITLTRIAPLRPSTPLHAVVGGAAIAVMFAITLGISGLLGAGRDWAGLLIIFTLPAAIAAWVFVAVAVPKLMPRILGN